MAAPTKAKIYLRIRRWVDRDLIAHFQSISPFLAFVPIICMTPVGTLAAGLPVLVGWAVAISLSLAWTAFVVWRGARLCQAVAIKGDRAYDQKDKFLLSPEYHGSESVTATSQRKRSQRRRSRG